MLIERKSALTGKVHKIDLNVTMEQIVRFQNRKNTGEYIQHIFPELSASDR